MDNYEPAATAFHLTKNADYYNADSISLEGINYQVIQDSQTASITMWEVITAWVDSIRYSVPMKRLQNGQVKNSNL